MPEEPKTYSVQLRIRRITHEDAYLAVLITDKLVKPDAQGVLRIDTDALRIEALNLADNELVEWRMKSTVMEPHPIQRSRPPDRQIFYSADDPGASS